MAAPRTPTRNARSARPRWTCWTNTGACQPGRISEPHGLEAARARRGPRGGGPALPREYGRARGRGGQRPRHPGQGAQDALARAGGGARRRDGADRVPEVAAETRDAVGQAERGAGHGDALAGRDDGGDVEGDERADADGDDGVAQPAARRGDEAPG